MTTMFDSKFKGKVVTESNSQALAEQLAKDVAVWLQGAVDARGEATLVVSGGSTPAPFFKALSQSEIEWQKIKVTLADERWVPPDHKLSNEKLVRESLLINAAAAATFVPLYIDAETPDVGKDASEANMRALPSPFDVVILGMGGDGHTASLFPGVEGLTEACQLDNKKMVWPMYPDHLEEARISLTLAALLNASQLVLHVTGEDKLEVFNNAVNGSGLPIASVIDAAKDRLQVYWA